MFGYLKLSKSSCVCLLFWSGICPFLLLKLAYFFIQVSSACNWLNITDNVLRIFLHELREIILNCKSGNINFFL